MKHILFVTTIYRIGERVFPIIPKLAETYKLSLLTLYQMHPEGQYKKWNGTYDMRNKFHIEYDKYFDNHWTGTVYNKGMIDVSQFDAIIHDDCRDRSGLNKLYQDAKQHDVLMLGNQHGGNDFKPRTYPITGVDSNFDKMFFFGQNELDYYKDFVDESRYMLGGIPSNDKLKDYERTNEHILVITQFLGNNPRAYYKGYEFKEFFIKHVGLKEIQEKYDKPVLVKVKSRGHDAPSYDVDINYVNNLLSKSEIYGEVVFDVEDDNKFISDSVCVVGAGSTLMYKPIQKGIPTVMIKGAGESDFFGNFPGLLELNVGKNRIIDELDRQDKDGRDEKYLEYVMYGSSDYTSVEKYVEGVKKLI